MPGASGAVPTEPLLACLSAGAKGVRVQVHVQPGASKDAVQGMSEGALKLRISAPPVEGAANERCQAFLARELLGIARGRVQLVSGDKSRHKTFEVEGLSLAEVAARLKPHLPE